MIPSSFLSFLETYILSVFPVPIDVKQRNTKFTPARGSIRLVARVFVLGVVTSDIARGLE